MRLVIAFGKKDPDLKVWRLALKNGGYSVNEQIVSMIKADVIHRTIKTPTVEPEFVNNVPKSMQLNLLIDDPSAINSIARIPEYQKSAYIKALIRKNLYVNAQDKQLKNSAANEPETPPVSSRKTSVPKKEKKTEYKPEPRIEIPKQIETAEITEIIEDSIEDNEVASPNLDFLSNLAGED